ncbi:glycosyltransferase family 2 protein [Microbulbifer epialgicus]|uniref:Glycosyltransferase n=1 Tax=Microbulbifer epialgicus TaxID=393907 RepID=A0ABV4P3Q3_9GAMM
MVKFIKSLFSIDLLSDLVPIVDIEPVDGGGEELHWRSLGIDPQFSLPKGCLRRGWYMFELRLIHNRSSANASLYVNTGSGFSEEERYSLSCISERIVKRVLYFPKGVQELRFDPMEEAGLFSIAQLRLVPLMPRFAYSLLAKRLIAKHPRFRKFNRGEVLANLKNEAIEQGGNWVDLGLSYYAQTFSRKCTGLEYQEWIDQVEALRLPKSEPVTDTDGPLISIILPTYNTEVTLLRDCINSVLAQSYSNWELCIADDASPESEVKACLEEYQSLDPRIQVVFRKDNGHISAASNSALALVTGEYVALLDHDDTLAPYALQKIIEAIADNPKALLLYSDEDKIDELGQRFAPHFKSNWNPDLLLSQNYICHLTILKAALVENVGGFRLGVEGSQDHDLLLRCMPYLNADNVVHIPEILYHWRAISGSTAQAGSAKIYAETAGLRAVSDYLKSQGLQAAAVPGTVPNSYRVRWAIPEPAPLVSLLVPTRDGVDILKPCVEAILSKTNYPNFELLILDNQSSCEATLHFLEEVSASDSRVTVHRWNHPFNYSAINNFGVELVKGEIIGLINNDIEPINDDWLSEMAGQVLRPEIGCVGAKLYYPNDTIQHGGVILGIGGVAGHAHKYFNRNEYGYFSRLHLVQNLSAVTAACLLLRKKVFEEVGGLNEEDLAVSFNDVDLCLKVREAGYRNLWTPYAELYHHESVSRGADDTMIKRRRAQREAEYMRSQWGDLLDKDPAYNPNLTLVHEDFSLA